METMFRETLFNFYVFHNIIEIKIIILNKWFVEEKKFCSGVCFGFCAKEMSLKIR